MSDLYTSRHQKQRAANDADQLELAAVRSGSQVFEEGIADERIAGSLEDLEDHADHPGITRFQRYDLGTEAGAGRVVEEVERRKRIMQNAYPFEVGRNSVTYRPSASGFYEFCLAAACSPSITQGEFVNFPRKFERAVSTLIQMFFGDGSQAMHLGAPRDSGVGTTFKKGMATLHTQSGEWIWRPEEGLPANPTMNGDEGVDFVVWHPMLDSREGALFLLAQCACGGDWLEKWNDLKLEKLQKWFSPMTRVPPVRAFATPHHVVDGLLHEALREAGLVFDRARLALIAEKNAHHSAWTTWKTALEPVSLLVLNSSQAGS